MFPLANFDATGLDRGGDLARIITMKLFMVLGALLAGVVGCRNAGQVQSQPSAAGPASHGHSSSAASASGHGAALPGIECPLRSKGIDPSHLRPFAEVADYIAFLERPDRAVWQRPDEVIAALNLSGHETVVDLGAGSGYFSFRLARALPRGQVIAEDTEPEMIRHIHHKAQTTGVRNLRPVLIGPDDPEITEAADLILICDVLHHVKARADWLAKVVRHMKAGARLALIEFKEGDLPQGPPEAAKIPRAQLLPLANAAGLTLDAEKADLLPYQTFLILRKPA